MRHWSIGARLTLWYSLILLAGLGLFGGGIWLVVTHSLNATIDESLAAQAKGVATVLQTEYKPLKPAHLQEELGEYADATPEGRLIEVRGPQGELLIGTGLATAGASKDHYRRLETEATVQGRKYRILVAEPLEEIGRASCRERV